MRIFVFCSQIPGRTRIAMDDFFSQAQPDWSRYNSSMLHCLAQCRGIKNQPDCRNLLLRYCKKFSRAQETCRRCRIAIIEKSCPLSIVKALDYSDATQHLLELLQCYNEIISRRESINAAPEIQAIGQAFACCRKITACPGMVIGFNQVSGIHGFFMV